MDSEPDYSVSPMTEYVEGERLRDYYLRMAEKYIIQGEYFWTCMEESQNVNNTLNSSGKRWKCETDRATRYIKVIRVA